MTDWIAVTEHAAQRWHERTDRPGIGPIVAWNEAERRDFTDLTGDEFRYHRDSDTVLVRSGSALVTVIDVPTARPSIQREIYGDTRAPRVS